jgi:hypothetical protein
MHFEPSAQANPSGLQSDAVAAAATAADSPLPTAAVTTVVVGGLSVFPWARPREDKMLVKRRKANSSILFRVSGHQANRSRSWLLGHSSSLKQIKYELKTSCGSLWIWNYFHARIKIRNKISDPDLNLYSDQNKVLFPINNYELNIYRFK